jgi:hypothetical protein
MAESAEEVVWLEQELAALRSQCAARAQCAGDEARLSVDGPGAHHFFGYLMWKDAVMGGFAAAGAIAALVWYARPRNVTFRWIDMAMPTSNEFDRGPSQAQKVERWIAERESRLAELRRTEN